MNIMLTVRFMLILFVILASTFLINYAHAQTCNAKTLRKVDLSVARIITIGNSGRQFPEQKGTELKKYCSQNAAYLKEIERYKGKCMKGLSKQIASILIYSIKNSIAQLCNKDSKKLNELIASTKCINTATPEINKCYTNLIDSIQGIVNADPNKKIPHVCCEYYRIFPCIITKTKRIPVCTEQHVDTAMNFVRSMLGNAIDLLCSEYSEGSDKCDTLGRPPRKLKHQRRTKSFLIPLLDMFDSFPEV